MDYKKELVKYAHLIEQKGFVNACAGNISIYDKENNRLYITPSQKRKLFLKEDEVAVLDYDSEAQIEGSVKASSEYRLHKAALDVRKDANAVIHSHCTYLTAFALQCKDIKIDCNTAFAVFVKGEIKCVPYGEPGTTHIADGLEDALADRDIALLGNHGVVCVGQTLESAFALLEDMEETVKTYVISKSFGEPVKIPDIEKLINR